MKALTTNGLTKLIELIKSSFISKTDVQTTSLLDIDDEVTEDSTNLVTSGAVFEAIKNAASGTPLIDIQQTSGAITLTDNSAHKITAESDMSFVYPSITDTTISHNIIVYLTVGDGAFGIDFNTFFFKDGVVPQITSGDYIITMTYSPELEDWLVNAEKYIDTDTTKLLMKFTVRTDNDDYDRVTLGFATNLPEDNLTVDWGDGSTPDVYTTGGNKTHVWTNGSYPYPDRQITITTTTGKCPYFKMPYGLRSIDTPLLKMYDNDGVTPKTDFTQFCYSQTDIVQYPNDALDDNLFKRNPQITNLTSAFAGISVTNTLKIPSTLLKPLVNLTNATSLFENTKLKNVPTGFFMYNTSLTNLSKVFYNASIQDGLNEDMFSGASSVTNLSNAFFRINYYSFTSAITTVPSDLLKDCVNLTNVRSLFQESKITGIGAGLFDNCTKITDFSMLLRSCANITSIPADLFKYNTEATTFEYAFYGMTNLVSCPSDIFRYNTKVTNFAYAFQNDSKLEMNTVDLFKYNTACANFGYVFMACNKVQLSANTFCDDSDATQRATRFVGLGRPIFYQFFYTPAWNGTNQGTAPQLWNYTFDLTPSTYMGVFYSKAAALSNYANIPSEWKDYD